MNCCYLKIDLQKESKDSLARKAQLIENKKWGGRANSWKTINVGPRLLGRRERNPERVPTVMTYKLAHLIILIKATQAHDFKTLILFFA